MTFDSVWFGSSVGLVVLGFLCGYVIAVISGAFRE